MRDSAIEGFFTGASIVGFIALVCGYVWGYQNTRDLFQEKAIQAGVAHWEVDPATGKTAFVYNTPAGEKAKP